MFCANMEVKKTLGVVGSSRLKYTKPCCRAAEIEEYRKKGKESGE